jgi:hypothetical protein
VDETTKQTWGRERRAQTGILQFAEEMQEIRNRKQYPGAEKKKNAWSDYCQERWAMSERSVREFMQAAPVLRRLSGAHRAAVSVKIAATVASLPELVQDAIVVDRPVEKVAKARAKAARAAAKKGKDETEQVKAAQKAKPPKQSKPRAPMAPADDLRPPSEDPRDHGSKRLKLKRDALMDDYRLLGLLVEEGPGSDDEVETMLARLDQHHRVHALMEAELRGDTKVTEADLEEFADWANHG